MRREGIKYESATKHVCNLSKNEIDKYAAKAAQRLNCGPGSDLTALITVIGGRIHYVDLFNDGDMDTIYVHGPCDFDVMLSNISSPRRDRFTIAHELGHYLLHSLQGEVPIVAARSGSSNRAEWEANWFAAGFLMPERIFKAEASKDSSLQSLARTFGVSEAAAEVRMRVLGLK